MTADAAEDVSLAGLVDKAVELAGTGDLRLGRLVGAFEQTGFAALVFIPAAALVTPLSGIPLFSSICGLTILLLSAQWLAGRSNVWLPGWLARRRIAGEKVRSAMSGLRPVAAWLDRHSRTRARFLFRTPFRFALPLACVLFGAAIPFLEVIPFTSSLLGAVVCLIAFARMTRDGLYALLAFIPLAVALWALSALI
ncbi:MAG: exopolysaccharide biosynthesis protein [Roseibium sp.]